MALPIEAETPLSIWGRGDEGVIADIHGTNQLSARLREVGAVPGSPVRILRVGCLLVIQVGTSRFCLRKVDAACIRGKKAA
jgi:Fe2+ transport system protein FeoA